MSILIKSGNVPSSCWECKYENIISCPCAIEPASKFKDRRHPRCPIVEIPEPHGDLIDRDEAEKIMRDHMCGTGYQSDACFVIRCENITPTVIEAEGENESNTDSDSDM